MKEEILTHLNDPRQLEKMYRAEKALFKREFSALYPEIKGNLVADSWNERLNFESDEINWGTQKEIVFVLITALVAGLIAKIPHIFQLDEEFFYPRNIGFIVFPALSAYFAWKNKLAPGKIGLVCALTLAAAIFINALPHVDTSDTLILSCIHLVLFLWSILGFVFIGELKNSHPKRLSYLKFNGDLLIMTGLILIAGAFLSGITIGLFSLIGLEIENFYFNYFGIFGLAAAPLIGAFLTQTNPQLVGKVSPVIAKIFSPLVLFMLIIYLLTIVYVGKDPYNDRDFLLIFNGLIIGVMAIIFFSIAETSKATKTQAEIWVLLLLSIITVIVNGIALSAILFRITEFGITPNRAAVLGGNLLMIIHLILVTIQLFKVSNKKIEISAVGNAIVSYLPVYVIWTIVVTFLFPLIFGFK